MTHGAWCLGTSMRSLNTVVKHGTAALDPPAHTSEQASEWCAGMRSGRGRVADLAGEDKAPRLVHREPTDERAHWLRCQCSDCAASIHVKPTHNAWVLPVPEAGYGPQHGQRSAELPLELNKLLRRHTGVYIKACENWEPCHRQQRLVVCLLYTSDAADE